MQVINMMLLMLVVGTMILMGGILLFRDSGQSLRSALNLSIACGSWFFVALGAQILVLAIL
jgi:hypothetical protein